MDRETSADRVEYSDLLAARQIQETAVKLMEIMENQERERERERDWYFDAVEVKADGAKDIREDLARKEKTRSWIHQIEIAPRVDEDAAVEHKTRKMDIEPGFQTNVVKGRKRIDVYFHDRVNKIAELNRLRAGGADVGQMLADGYNVMWMKYYRIVYNEQEKKFEGATKKTFKGIYSDRER